MDMQTLLPRSADVARARQVEINRPAAAQQHGAEELHRRAARRQHVVGETAQVRGGRVSRDGRRAGNGDQKQSPGQKGDGTTGGGAPVGAGDAGPKAGGEPSTRGRIVDVVLGLGSGQEGI